MSKDFESKLIKSAARVDEEGYETYKGLAFDPNDDTMFVSKEEIDEYRQSLLEDE